MTNKITVALRFPWDSVWPEHSRHHRIHTEHRHSDSAAGSGTRVHNSLLWDSPGFHAQLWPWFSATGCPPTKGCSLVWAYLSSQWSHRWQSSWSPKNQNRLSCCCCWWWWWSGFGGQQWYWMNRFARPHTTQKLLPPEMYIWAFLSANINTNE